MAPGGLRLPELLVLTPGVCGRRGVAAASREADALRRAVNAAAASGAIGCVLREPSLPDGPYLVLAQALRREVRWLALHDRPHLVAAARADAVHLGFRSLRPREARAVVGPGVAIGFSSHATDAHDAWTEADYLTFGPVFETPSKADFLPATGLEALDVRVGAAGRPVYALGGVGQSEVEACLRAGAYGVAMLRGVLGADDPRGAAADIFRALGRAQGSSGGPGPSGSSGGPGPSGSCGGPGQSDTSGRSSTP